LPFFYEKHLLLPEDFSESRIKISVLTSFPAINRFSPVFTPSYWMQEKSAKSRMSLAAFGKIFRITGGWLWNSR
jgi:hypothetical protein